VLSIDHFPCPDPDDVVESHSVVPDRFIEQLLFSFAPKMSAENIQSFEGRWRE
jgi:hypothetical protein